MVGDVLGVGRPDADVDERDAGIALPCQVVGGHLVAVPGRACHQRLGLGRRMLPAHGDVARQHEAVERAFAHELLASPAHELIDIAVVVGEQNPALHVAPIAAGVVDEPAQREIDAQRVEQRQRIGRARLAPPQAVGEFVAHRGQPGRRKIARQLARGHIGAGDLLRALDHVGIGDLLGADPRLDFRIVFRRQWPELLQKIAAEGTRMRDRGFVDAWMLQLAECAHRRRALELFLPVDQAQHGIIEFRARLGGRHGARVEVAVERPRKCRGGPRVKLFEPVDSGGGSGMLRRLRFYHGPWLGLHRTHNMHMRPQRRNAIPGQRMALAGKNLDRTRIFCVPNLKKAQRTAPMASARRTPGGRLGKPDFLGI